MKYTRYNINQKKKTKNNFLVYLAITLIAALVLGTSISFILHKVNGDGKPNKIVQEKEKEKDKGQLENNKVEPNHSFYLLQCGVFKVKDNAEAMRKKLEELGNPFIVEEGDLFRVYFGVYTKEKCDETLNMLKEKGFSTSKIALGVFYDDLSTGELCELIEANFKIINKASEVNVKSVKTSELKTWVDSLEGINENMKHYKDVNELKEYIKSLPEEVNKTKASEMIGITYNKLKQFKK